jgi:hypothetical protein
MTPKEKAIELVEQFSSVLMYDELYDDSVMCARIAVDEILKITWVDKFLTVEDYWKEVKQEIEKL